MFRHELVGGECLLPTRGFKDAVAVRFGKQARSRFVRNDPLPQDWASKQDQLDVSKAVQERYTAISSNCFYSEMNSNEFPDFSIHRAQWSEDIQVIQQNRLLGESAFSEFARKRGVPLWGTVAADIAELHAKSWIKQDGTDQDCSPLFHPFRLYPLHRILESWRLGMATSVPPDGERTLALVSSVLKRLPSVETITGNSLTWNRISELAVLLEPIYWPRITGHRISRTATNSNSAMSQLRRYRQATLTLVEGLPLEKWRETHSELREQAAQMDENSTLSLLLRTSLWKEREKLTGRISGALWIRHLAEVIRRAFEEAHGVTWPEEDEAYGYWNQGGRKRAFGSDRPLDDDFHSKSYFAYRFGLFTGSPLRWYVEGETEYFAILELLPRPERYGIEVVDLKGKVKAGRRNLAVNLDSSLRGDRRLRRFSVVTFDWDVEDNRRALSAQIDADRIVGHVEVYRPDFEFANFALDELVEIASSD